MIVNQSNDSAQLANALRLATRHVHKSLDHHPLLAPLISKTLTVENYKRALAALHAPQAAFEASLSEFVSVESFPARLPDLEADLAELDVQPWPLQNHLLVASSAAEHIGQLYVVEGSRLGALVIARQLQQQLTSQTPRRFFSGAADMGRWASFWKLANQYDSSTNREIICNAAIQAFECYRQHLDACSCQDTLHTLSQSDSMLDGHTFNP